MSMLKQRSEILSMPPVHELKQPCCYITLDFLSSVCLTCSSKPPSVTLRLQEASRCDQSFTHATSCMCSEQWDPYHATSGGTNDRKWPTYAQLELRSAHMMSLLPNCRLASSCIMRYEEIVVHIVRALLEVLDSGVGPTCLRPG